MKLSLLFEAEKNFIESSRPIEVRSRRKSLSIVSFSSAESCETAAHSSVSCSGGNSTILAAVAPPLLLSLAALPLSLPPSTMTMLVMSSDFSERESCFTTIVAPVGVSSFE